MIKKKYFIYLFLSFGAAFISFFKLGFLAANLPSEQFGLYSIAILSFVYIIYFGSVGGNEYMLKIGSINFSSDESVVNLVRNNALFYGFLGVSLIAFLFLVFSFFFFKESFSLLILGMVTLALVTYPYNVLESYYRAKQKIFVFSLMLFLKAFFVLVGIYFFIDSYGVVGVFISEILSVFLIVFFIFFKNKFFLKNGLDYPFVAIKNMYLHGFYVCLSNLVRNFSMVADRYAIAFLFGFASFGVYSFIMIVYQGMLLLTGIIMNILGPILIEKYSGNSRALLFLLAKASFFVLVLSIFLFPIFTYFIKLIVNIYFEQYDDAQVYYLLKLVYFISVFSFLIFLFDWFFICISKEVYISFFSFISFLLIAVSISLSHFMKLDFEEYVMILFSLKVFIFLLMSLVLLIWYFSVGFKVYKN